MKTIVYLIRHATKITNLIDEYNAADSDELKDQKRLLSIKGEQQAKELAELPIFNNVEIIYSSPYVRCLGTAKYLADKLNLTIKVDANLGEHILGNFDPEKRRFHVAQTYQDFDYRLPGGESFNDVKNRISPLFETITKWNCGKEIAIFSHHTPLMGILANYCQVGYNLDDELILTYNDELSIPSRWHQPDGYKITLDDEMNVTNIEKIEMAFND